ncbi:hypothetical protein [Lysinibacillus sp. LZ02]|uniref:hypothetical protein n=1 Tax=Lysinibacillus sp. LZ02 TaxID=3420668 RepID=UPI003D36816A
MMDEKQVINNGKIWMIIGIAIAVIGLLFTIAMSVVSNQNINRLTEQCEKSGGQAEVTEHGFIVTTSYEFTCVK